MDQSKHQLDAEAIEVAQKRLSEVISQIKTLETERASIQEKIQSLSKDTVHQLVLSSSSALRRRKKFNGVPEISTGMDEMNNTAQEDRARLEMSANKLWMKIADLREQQEELRDKLAK